MTNFVDKPDDYDSIIHGESRFVIVEKKEDISKKFFIRMRYYWKVTRKSLLETLVALRKFKGD